MSSIATPATIVAVRFGLASLCVLPWLPCSARASHRTVLHHGAGLGALYSVGFALYTTALNHTTASRVAFLFYLNVKLVPAFSFW